MSTDKLDVQILGSSGKIILTSKDDKSVSMTLVQSKLEEVDDSGVKVGGKSMNVAGQNEWSNFAQQADGSWATTFTTTEANGVKFGLGVIIYSGKMKVKVPTACSGCDSGSGECFMMKNVTKSVTSTTTNVTTNVTTTTTNDVTTLEKECSALLPSETCPTDTEICQKEIEKDHDALEFTVNVQDWVWKSDKDSLKYGVSLTMAGMTSEGSGENKQYCPTKDCGTSVLTIGGGGATFASDTYVTADGAQKKIGAPKVSESGDTFAIEWTFPHFESSLKLDPTMTFGDPYADIGGGAPPPAPSSAAWRIPGVLLLFVTLTL
jgi:hypothetical protein